MLSYLELQLKLRRTVTLMLGVSIGTTIGFTGNVESARAAASSTTVTGSPQYVQPAPPAISDGHLFGDWGGLREYLDSKGIDYDFSYTTETAGNVSGGTQRGFTYTHVIGAGVDVDLGKLVGVQGLSFHTLIINKAGASDAHLFGDNYIPDQEDWGGTGGAAAHLVWAYFEQTLENQTVDVKIGRMPVMIDFSSSDLYCNFMNNSVCGNPKTVPGADPGMSAFPDGNMGGVLKIQPSPLYYVKFGIYEVNKYIYNYPKFPNWTFDGSGDTGAEIPVELAYQPVLGPDQLPGHYKLGAGYDTSTYNEFYDNADEVANALPRKQVHGEVTAWALADQMLIRNGPGKVDGLSVTGGVEYGDPTVSAYHFEVFGGLIDRGFLATRPKDTVGVLFSYLGVSGQLGKEQELDEEFGLPFENGATGKQTHEEVIELNYDIQVARGLNVMPDFQYIIRPNGQSNIGNAAVFGLKTNLDF
jgi:porin